MVISKDNLTSCKHVQYYTLKRTSFTISYNNRNSRQLSIICNTHNDHTDTRLIHSLTKRRENTRVTPHKWSLTLVYVIGDISKQ